MVVRPGGLDRSHRKVGFASAAIALGAGAGSGMAHGVSAVARTRVNGTVPNSIRVHVPAREFPSALHLPSKVPPIAGNVILTFESCMAKALLGLPAGPRSML